MAYNSEYPYFDAGQWNSDWLINEMKRLSEEVLGLETYKYLGENEVLDLNQLTPNSVSMFTSNFNVLNAPITGVDRLVFTNGSAVAFMQRLYDLTNQTVYARTWSASGGWKAWKLTQNAPGTVISTDNYTNSGDFNDLPANKAMQLYTGRMLNAPINGYGYFLSWKAINNTDIIQLFFSTDNNFLYMRQLAGSAWTPWVEANHIDLTNYIHAIPPILSSGSIQNLPSNITALVYKGAEGNPYNGEANILTLGSQISSVFIQLLITRTLGYHEIYIRDTADGEWRNLTNNYTIMHRKESTTPNDIYGGSFCTSLFPNSGIGDALVIGAGRDLVNADTYQFAVNGTGTIYTRIRNGATWGNWIQYQKVSSTRALIASAMPIEYSTDDDGNERTMIGENLYSEAAKTQNTELIALPGQSLFHSDDGTTSYMDALLSREDLDTYDTVVTNLEQWDMDIPAEELTQRVTSCMADIHDKAPLTTFVIYSVPPLDLPYLGDEMYAYKYPSGMSLAELDALMTELSTELDFTYITWSDYKYMSRPDLLSRYDNLYEQPVYKRSAQTYVAKTMPTI